MANACLRLSGFILSFVGWICLIIAASTSDWVIRCSYGLGTCKKLDELETTGLWEHCMISTALYHCYPLNEILGLPVYVQACRALMIAACILGIPGTALLISAVPCFHLGDESVKDKNKRSGIGGILMLIVAVLALGCTIWFPVAAHEERELMGFGFSLYLGWMGGASSLLGGCTLTCCSIDSTPSYHQNNQYSYYSKQDPPTSLTPPAGSHAKTAHV